MKRISVLGSTGSIGVNTLRLLDECYALGEDYRIEVLTGGCNAALLAQQALKYRPALTVIADKAQWSEFRTLMEGSGLDIACGEDALIGAAARPVDWVMAAIVGIAGLKPTWAAAGTGAVLALANKEALVCGGPALKARVEAHGGTLLPVDSEHNAIFQVLERDAPVSRLILTASGGPFLGKTREDLKAVSVSDALKHPNWSMGAKITIDSATLANKGLELIEAAYLFDMPSEKIDVVIHPQSVIHSLVEYADGSTLAQLGPPDMRVPISYCLGWPERLAWSAPALDLKALRSLTFAEPDLDAFPMLALARQALESGPHMPIVFNAANEVCVKAFLEGRIAFCDIAEYVSIAMLRAHLPSKPFADQTSRAMEPVLEIDAEIRRLVLDLFARAA